MNLALISSLSSITNKTSLSNFTGAVNVSELASIAIIKGQLAFICHYKLLKLYQNSSKYVLSILLFEVTFFIFISDHFYAHLLSNLSWHAVIT